MLLLSPWPEGHCDFVGFVRGKGQKREGSTAARGWTRALDAPRGNAVVFPGDFCCFQPSLTGAFSRSWGFTAADATIFSAASSGDSPVLRGPPPHPTASPPAESRVGREPPKHFVPPFCCFPRLEAWVALGFRLLTGCQRCELDYFPTYTSCLTHLQPPDRLRNFQGKVSLFIWVIQALLTRRQDSWAPPRSSTRWMLINSCNATGTACPSPPPEPTRGLFWPDPHFFSSLVI